jgi:hypothetical protein
VLVVVCERAVTKEETAERAAKGKNTGENVAVDITGPDY